MSDEYKLNLDPVYDVYTLVRKSDQAEIKIVAGSRASRVVHVTLIYLNELRSLGCHHLAIDIFEAWAISVFVKYYTERKANDNA